MNRVVSLAEYQAMVGSQLGVSEWMEIDQRRIDLFAGATEDYQFIHVNPERAKDTPYGGTIAHGYLTLSLLSKFAEEIMPEIEGVTMMLNYGLNKVRFLNPVKVGQMIRGDFTLRNVSERGTGQILITCEVVIEIEAENRPACIIEWLSMAILGDG